MAGLLGAAWHQGGTALVHEVIQMQAVGRMNALDPVPFYYYFTASFINYALAFPIAIIIFICYGQEFLKKMAELSPDFRLLKLLAAWLLIILIGMSIPTDEKMRYILAITPAISLAAAYLYYRDHSHRGLNILKTVLHYFFLLLPFLCLLMTSLAYVISRQKQFYLALSYPWLFLLLFLLCASVIICRKTISQFKLYELSIFIIGLMTFIIVYSGIAQPLNIEFNRAKPFVEQVEALQQPGQKLVFYRIGPDGEDIKYQVAANQPIQAAFIRNPAALLVFPGPAIFIAKTEDFNQLARPINQHLRLLFTGQLGHQSCVVFTRN
jgi:hypothetical protein